MAFSRLCSRGLGLSLRRLFSSSSSSSSAPPLANVDLSPNPTSNYLIKSLFRERDLDRCVAIFKSASASFPAFRSRGIVYEATVLRLSKAGRLDGVADILDSQKHLPEISQESFGARLISLYGMAGMADHASTTFRQLPSLGCPCTVKSFNALLAAFIRAGDPDRAIEAFRSANMEYPDIELDVLSYTTVIRALCAKGKLDAAMGVLELMEERGVEPNVITFDVLLNEMYKSNKSNEAEKLWAMMAEKKIDPDVRCFNTKMRWLVDEGRTSEAAEVFEELESRGLKPDGHSFTFFIMGLCKNGNLEKAKKVFDEMIKRGCVVNWWTVETLVPRLCEAGDLDMALKLCKEGMRRRCSVTPEVMQAVVDGLVKCSRVKDAKELLELGWSKKHYKRESLRMPLPCLVL